MESELPEQPVIPRDQMRKQLENATLAFRGYNVTNLGRTPELLRHPKYGEILRQHLSDASEVCAEVTQEPVCLVKAVEEGVEFTLGEYAAAISLIVAVEQAQLAMLAHCHDIDAHRARMAFGFSLGEIGALVFGGVMSMADALRVPLAMARDCVALAGDVTLAVLFSRGEFLPVDQISLFCQQINQGGQGVIGISAQLAPNSLLVMGTQHTMEQLRERVRAEFGRTVQLRKNEHRWPPLHTPIMWEKQIPNRAAVLMHTLPGGFTAPRPPVFSLATGKFSYDGIHTRQILHAWVDQTQQLWSAVYETLAMGIELVVHVGPAPNIVPATYTRLAANVSAQMKQSRRIRALSVAVRRTWLPRILPKRAALLRAPYVRQVALEDWLLANPT